MNIAEFYATLKLQPDTASLSKADAFFKALEKKFDQHANRMGKKGGILNVMFKLNTNLLNKRVQNALDKASVTSVLHVARFQINQGALDFSLRQAMIRAGHSATVNVNARVNSVNSPNRQTGGGTRSPSTRTAKPSSKGVLQDTQSAMSSIRNLTGVGLAGFGIGKLNERIQQLELLPVSMEAVTGNKTEANRQLAFIRSLGAEVGATRLELAPDYTKFLASAQGTKLEPFAQSGFRSLTRYGKVMGLDSESMKGTFKA